MNSDSHLHWQALGERILLDGHVFQVTAARRQAEDGREAEFYLLHSPSWVNIIAETEDAQGRTCFIMVRQYRHGEEAVSLEFPGGVVDPDEDSVVAAMRELKEETGYSAESLIEIGRTNPNPAIMKNRAITYLAKGVHSVPDSQNLDANEIMDIELVPVKDILLGRRSDFLNHAIMMSAAYWYVLHTSSLQI
ncbi:NUDIX hydrolase [Spirochaeta dissipatitropha]